MTTPPPIHLGRLPSPLGTLLIAHGGGHLCALDFQDGEARFRQYLARRFGHLPAEQRRLPDEIADALQSYLAGDLNALRHIPVHASGTRFQQQVWNALREIPVGSTWSYAQLAAHIGQPDAVRAVGAANGRNPVSIVVPCHRVIGSNGELTGYAGGLDRKRWLLVHEGVLDEDERPQKVSNGRRRDNRTLPLFGV
ncbi:MAG TPA: methylated-DNA--[protein]-cysteine S-methyltransferase [Moraxellaceae bacterium]